MTQNLSSAAVLIGALRVKIISFRSTMMSNNLDPDQDDSSVQNVFKGYQQTTCRHYLRKS